jgi:V/A-type H+-transporting ATPase subunit D
VVIKFQYNKTSLQEMNKQLTMRERALPTIRNKESALRMEVKKARDAANALEKKLAEKKQSYAAIASLWGEFEEDLIRVKEVGLNVKKIAGVKTPVLTGIDFEEKRYSLFTKPSWFVEGIELLKEIAAISIEAEVYIRKMNILDFARRKTTQKVNLYEKVQIPGYQEAIMKIKRFMEDEENLSKSSQKILKSRFQNQG